MSETRSSMRRYTLWLLIAVELLMSFSFFGYFHIEPISVTTAYIPVLLAGALTGPMEAVAVGAVFGLTSMWKASASYVMASDQLFSPFFSGNPWGSLVLSLGSRMLFGLATGLLYLAVRRLRHPSLGVGLVSFLGRTIHSFMVYGAMALFFPEAGYGPADAFSGFFSPATIAANLIITGIVLIFWNFAHSQIMKRFQRRLALSRSMQMEERYHRMSLILVMLVTLTAAFGVTFYFVHRIDYVLTVNGIVLSDTSYADVLHLQIQFLFGIISMMVLVILFLIINRRYNTWMAYEARLDALTGALTRRAFFQACSRTLKTLSQQEGPLGYFIMLDLDFFKDINDTQGHPEGDRALREVAKALRDSFGRDCLISRLGGDEFALLICSDISKPELEVTLRHFMERIHRITFGQRGLTCSIGALPVRPDCAPEQLYLEADRLLYTAKEQGRNQYVIGS